MKANPLCERCLEMGIVRQMREVHHIIPIDIERPNEGLIYGWDNLMSVCISCHKEIHVELKQ